MKRKITPFQKLVALALTIALVAMTVSPAFAAETLYISHSTLNLDYWYSTGGGEEVNCTWDGLRFVGNDQYITRVDFYFQNNSVAESGTIRAVLFDTMGAGAPSNTETPVAYSNNTYSVNGLITATLVTFEFTADTSAYYLNSSQYYGIAWEVSSQLGSTITFGVDTGAGEFFADGEADRTYTTNPRAPIIYLYTSDTIGGGEPYTPPGTYDPTSYDTIIGSFVSFIVPLIIVLLPAFLLCFITRRVDKWLIIIGVTIGAGLGYYFNLVPLWLVFLVTIGLIGMAYQSVRGGGSN